MLKRTVLLGLMSFSFGLNAMQEAEKNAKNDVLAENKKLASAIDYYATKNYSLPRQLQTSLHSQVERTQILLNHYPENAAIKASFNLLQNAIDKILPQIKRNILAGIQISREKLNAIQPDIVSAPNRIKYYKNEALEFLNVMNNNDTLQPDSSELKKQKVDVTKQEIILAMKETIIKRSDNAISRISNIDNDVHQASVQLDTFEKELQELK